MKKIIFIFLTVFLLIFNLAAQISLAADTAPAGIEEINPADYGLPPTHVRISNLVEAIVNWVLILAGAGCMVALVYAGIRYALAGGNEEKVEQAKKILKYALIGVVIIIGAYALVQMIVEIIGGNVPTPPTF